MKLDELQGKPFKANPYWAAICAKAAEYGHPIPVRVGDEYPTYARRTLELEATDINTMFTWGSTSWDRWNWLHDRLRAEYGHGFRIVDLKLVADEDGNLLFDF